MPKSVRSTIGVPAAGGSYGIRQVERAPDPQPRLGHPSKNRTRPRSRPTTDSSCCARSRTSRPNGIRFLPRSTSNCIPRWSDRSGSLGISISGRQLASASITRGISIGPSAVVVAHAAPRIARVHSGFNSGRYGGRTARCFVCSASRPASTLSHAGDGLRAGAGRALVRSSGSTTGGSESRRSSRIAGIASRGIPLAIADSTKGAARLSFVSASVSVYSNPSASAMTRRSSGVPAPRIRHARTTSPTQTSPDGCGVR
jgi:hypothetical protein